MAMIVRNNAVANRTLSNLDKSDKARAKSAAKLSSGMKINSAADDASSLAISERMRVKLRALDQDAQNVQNGAAILNTAEGGIQGQIDLIRTIKAKVIDAANDHNTEEDRQTIQKELKHLYTQIENLAYDTDYNSKKPLIGDVPFDKANWSSAAGGNTTMPKDIDLDVIANNYAELDGITGPFDTFTEYSAATVSRDKMSNAVDGTPKIMTADFSSCQNVEDLDNVCVVVRGRDNNYSWTTAFFLTSDTSRNYRSAAEYNIKVPLGDTVESTINNLVNYINRNKHGVSSAVADGLKVEVTTSGKGTVANTANIYGRQDAGGTVTEYIWKYDGKGAGVSGKASGGRDNPVATDDDAVPGAKATLTLNLSDVESDSGFIFNSKNFRIVDPDETIQRISEVTLTKGQPASGGTNYFRYSFDGNEITFEAYNNGAYYNNYSVEGNYYGYREPVERVYDAYTSFNGAVETVQEGADTGNNAYWAMDLSGMTVNDFSQKYSGQYLEVSAYYDRDILRYKFYDSSLAPSINGFPEDTGSRESNKATQQIDINEIREAVKGGKTLAQAVTDKLSATAANRFEFDGDTVKILSSRPGTAGEVDTVTIQNETLRHYDINLAQLEGTVTIPDDLYGKGFRAYCATDNREWFNFVFTDGKVSYKSTQDNVKNYNINISEVTNAAELARAIYDQATPLLEGTDSKFNHHFRLAAEGATLTIYDHRRFDVTNYTDAEGNSVYQERGAKIADGVNLEASEPEPVDDGTKEKIFYAKDLVIQHTDKANMNIHIKIPQMTLDHIFDPLPVDPSTIFDYPVTDKTSRNALLGDPNPPGILDNGLQYMLDAVTFVGAQNNRLAHTAQNITTEMENLTASESTIRDADMAREFTEYTKSNVLAQAAQTVLAQANQLPSMVLELLG